MTALAPRFPAGFVSLEGYIAGRLTVAVLQRLGPEPTRAGFIETLNSVGTWDLGGYELRYARGDHRGSHAVYLTEITKEGGVAPIDRLAP